MPPTEQPTLIRTEDGALLLAKEGLTRLERREFWSLILVCGGLGIVFLIWPLFVPLPVPVDFWVESGILGLIALGLAGAELLGWNHASDQGSWRLDATGVEFRSRSGVNHRVAWAEVERVAWTDGSVRLVGARDRVQFTPRFLTPDDWQALRDRIEAELAPRFALTVHRPPREFRPGRVALVVVPIGLLALWFRWALPSLTPEQMRWSALVMLAVLLVPFIPISFETRTLRRQNPTWRTPRTLPTDRT